jgi:hypothetical protein
MDWQKFEQRCANKVCVWPMKSYKGLMENIPYPGQKSFSEGPEQVEDEPRAGRPSTSETDDNAERVRSGRRLTLRMISSEFSLNRCTVHQILTRDFGMRKRPMSHDSVH